MSEEQVQEMINQKIQQRYVQQREQWSTRLQELDSFIQNASPEQLSQLNEHWHRIFPDDQDWRNLEQTANSNEESTRQVPDRIIRFGIVDAPSLFGRFNLTIYPILDENNKVDGYIPGVSGRVKAQIESWLTNEPTITLFNSDHIRSEKKGTLPVEGDSADELEIDISASGKFTCILTTDTLNQWNKIF